MAGLNQEIWVADIQETLRQDAAFLSTMSDWTGYVNNEYINLPQAGAIGTPSKNTNAFPLAVSQRADTVKQIKIDLYNTPALLVTDLESYQLSYDKRQDVMGDEVRSMIEFAGNSVLQSIAPASAGKQHVVAGLLTYKDVLAAAQILDQDNVPAADRSLGLTTAMFYELLADQDVIRRGFNTTAVENGQIFELAGFKIFKRPSIATIGGKEASLGYQKRGVGQAVSSVYVMADSGDNGNGNPLYGGTIMTAFMKLGAGKARTDEKGTVALVRA